MKFHEAYRLVASLAGAEAELQGVLDRLETAADQLRQHGAHPAPLAAESAALARDVVRARAEVLSAAVGDVELTLHATVHVPSAGMWRWLRPWVAALAEHTEWTCAVVTPAEVVGRIDVPGVAVLTLQEWFDLEGEAALTDLTLVTDAQPLDLISEAIKARSWVTAALGTHAGADFGGITVWRAAPIIAQPYAPPLGTAAFAEAVDALAPDRPRVLWYPTSFGADPFAGEVDSLSVLETAREHDVTVLWVRDDTLIELAPPRARGYLTDMTSFAEAKGDLVSVGPADLFDAIEQSDGVWTTSTGLRDLFGILGRPDIEATGTTALATLPRAARPEAVASSAAPVVAQWTDDFTSEFLGDRTTP